MSVRAGSRGRGRRQGARSRSPDPLSAGDGRDRAEKRRGRLSKEGNRRGNGAEDARLAAVVRRMLAEVSPTLPAAAHVQLIAALLAVVARARADERRRWQAVRAVIDEQVQDEVLGLTAQTAAEAYLQQELGKLHAAVQAVPGAAPAGGLTSTGPGAPLTSGAPSSSRAEAPLPRCQTRK